MHHVMSRAGWYSHIVGEYRADLYVRGHLKVYRRNPLLRVVPSMFRFERGVKDYIVESKNQMHYSAPDIYDVKVQALTGTFRRNNGEIGNIMEFFNLNIYSTDLLPDKLISPFSENSHKYYYYLLDLFGRVPLVMSSSTPINNVRQSERKDIFDFVVKELQTALPNLSTERSNFKGDYYGRITRPVAFFLLAKLYLNVEVYTDNDWTDGIRPDGNKHWLLMENEKFNAWQAVMAYCDSITKYGYDLTQHMSDNFTVYNETSVENIFTIPTDKYTIQNQMQYTFRSRHYNHAKALGLGGENGASATLDALDVFGYGTDEEDPRFRLCYYADEVTDLQGNPVLLDDGCTPLVYEPRRVELDLSGKEYEKTAGARMKKYEVDPTSLKDGKLADNDIVLFRYADVLLMQSEAKVRAGGNGDAELEQVRRRVGAPSRPATLETLLDERLLELAWEGWRRQDLVRFGLFTRAYSHRPQVEDEATGFTTVFPIPEKVISMNPQLRQHKGY